MKIIVLANRDIASNYALNLLIPPLSGHDVSVFLSSKVGGRVQSIPQLETLKFFEQSLFNQLLSPIINDLYPKPLTSNSKCKTFEQMNEWLSQPIKVLNKINSIEEVDRIQKLKPDLIISIRYGNILKDGVIQVPRFGVLNLHSGLLPEYRGVMATFWSMLHGEKTIGTTLHYIENSSIDTGRVVAKTRFEVDKKKSYLWHVLQLYVEGVERILNTVSLIEGNKRVDTCPQGNSGQYFSFPQLDDFLEFENKGLTLVNEGEIIDFLRAQYY
ncbi:formyl transferase [Marinomonas balearica]|uniref:Methionyl-tRNA formyltransferase n=1 Tax=Marinomonas balearica TaxID=491947 RepID=A0A4R6M9T0_9GAMM|nr:formyl transferase [Marinomonas balearica]TDO96949.1 methionyl-tRNA formyltransferase [Marinomonas balearica]